MTEANRFDPMMIEPGAHLRHDGADVMRDRKFDGVRQGAYIRRCSYCNALSAVGYREIRDSHSHTCEPDGLAPMPNVPLNFFIADGDAV